jgi:gamma-glutamyl-gamma-aminobutyrate hydrolase PuuD
MFHVVTSATIRIGIYGYEPARANGRGVGLWSPGFHGFLSAAGAMPVRLEPFQGDESWCDILSGIQGVVLAGWPAAMPRMGDEEGLCYWCKERRVPLLAIDNGMLALNAAFGGANFLDLSREMPEALQHRHPPEPGVRHAILVEPGTQIAGLYGEGEIVVNSEHRQAIQRVAHGFRVGARALDGVIEEIEGPGENWFAMGVQWQPASGTASGLDIQVFRGLVEAACRRYCKSSRPRKLAASA